MKKIALAVLLLCSTNAMAQEVVSMDFQVNNVIYLGVPYDRLSFDATLLPNYISLNGAFRGTDGLSAPVTGTCFFTSGGGLFCNLQVDQNTINMNLDLGESNITGSMEFRNSSGFITTTGSLTLTDIR